ncbi:MAG: helix-turn-helix transcriptional regulator [Propionibacterium sp.]|nr:helix-turn-helix transcriptional regulator [Propionibacterium sp.]MDN6566895.1 helix-turn-helix transcriptional regulator [Actinomyces sp.]MDN6795607.1 helix-turn-helix transcriptional regulator [Propionibacterium sp.]
MDIASEIRAEMGRRNVGPSEIAESTGINRKRISNTINSHREPTLTELVEIGEALGVPAWEILRRTQEAPEKVA